MKSLAIAVENSENSKLGACSATYVTLDSCPPSCPLAGNGCYAERGKVQLHTPKGIGAHHIIARAEASAIARLSGWRPLRLHVSGDSRTATAARIVAAASRAYAKRGRGSKVWTYTHAWRTVPRAAWTGVSVLASCDTVEEIAEARARGYAAALVYDQPVHELSNATALVPCLHDVRGIPCDRCQLCWNADRLYANRQTILFRKR